MINEEPLAAPKVSKRSFDMDDSTIIFQGANKKINDTNSQKTLEGGSISTRTKEEEDEFDLSFDEDIFLDLQKGDFLMDE